jgi:hypothetical protein
MRVRLDDPRDHDGYTGAHLYAKQGGHKLVVPRLLVPDAHVVAAQVEFESKT